MAVIGLPTHYGLDQAIAAQDDMGYYIRPTRFSISETTGLWSMDRGSMDYPSIWYSSNISGYKRIDKGIVEFTCTIPPGSSPTERWVQEIQIFCQDKNENEFFFAFGQTGDPPDSIVPIPYMPTDLLRFRLQIIVSPLAIDSVFEFKYSQSQEIDEHDGSDNSHPAIIQLLRKYGIYMFPSEVSPSGEWVDVFPVFSGSIKTGDVVYRQANTKYVKAVNPPKGLALGVAKINDDGSRVIFGGLTLAPGLSSTIGQRVYLDPVLAKVTTVQGAVCLGISLGGEVFLLLQGSGGGGGGDIYGYGTNINQDFELVVDTLVSGGIHVDDYISTSVAPAQAAFEISNDMEFVVDIT